MKLSTTIIVASLFATVDAFGGRGQVSMRTSTYNLNRRQRFNNILNEVKENPSPAAIESVLLSSDTDTLIQKCNWKLRKQMIRKVTNLAEANNGVVAEGFGVPPTIEETMVTQQAAKVVKNEAKVAALSAAAAAETVRADSKAKSKAAKLEKASEATARANEAKAAAKPEPVAAPEPVAEVAAPEPVVEEAAAPEPVVEEAAAPEPVAEEAAAPVAAEEAAAPAAGEVTPKTIKQLRDATGAGMMDCKRALIEANGDQESASESLRKNGLAKADKKASRVAAEGKIVFATSGSKAVLVEVNCETDFVAKDGSFNEFATSVANAALEVEGDDLEALMNSDIGGSSAEASRQALVAKIGENIQVRRLNGRGGEGSTVGAYVHMNRIGVLVEMEGGSAELGADIAMHVAAMNPPFAVPEQVPADVLEKERRILSEQALESGKPPEIVTKMVEGRIRKYLEEICLVSQVYVKTNDKTVGQLLEENGAKMIGFTRIEVGEGIEKKEDNFAEEVAAMAAGGQ